MDAEWAVASDQEYKSFCKLMTQGWNREEEKLEWQLLVQPCKL